MFDALGCAGVARIDFFLTDHGPVLNEVNTMPGMTAAPQVPENVRRSRTALRAAGRRAWSTLPPCPDSRARDLSVWL
jgi:glutathione synthase/RimK-type ligase-like ATP-grasp enzyme